MKKWSWFILSACWILAAILNAYDHRSGIVVGYDIFAAAVFAVLGVAQRVCGQKGEQGKRLMKRIYLATILVVAGFLAVVLWMEYR